MNVTQFDNRIRVNLNNHSRPDQPAKIPTNLTQMTEKAPWILHHGAFLVFRT